MKRFIKIVKRVISLIPKNYTKTTKLFLTLSVLLLILDVFSIFLLIPLMISVLDQSSEVTISQFYFFEANNYVIVITVIVFFIIKNLIAIKINKYQTKVAYELSSEYSLLLSKYYILGNYLNFKKQKKSSIIKEIIFVANDFVGNVILSINTILSEFVLLIFIVLIGFYFYFYITLLVVVILTLIVFISSYYNKSVIKKINDSRSEDYENNISNLTNLLNGFMSIKSPELLHRFINTFYKSNQKLNYNYSILHSKRINNSRQTEIIMVIMLCLVFGVIYLFSLKGIGAVLFLSIFGTLFFKAIPSINKLNIGITNLNSHLYSLDILEEKITTISKITSENKQISFQKSIRLENISFSFQGNIPIISNFDMLIEKGDFISIKGISGVGKTTLLNIISKLIEPSSGKIIVDENEITQLNKYNYFNLITYLTQKPFIYEGTILENLTLKNDTYDLENINAILKSLDLLNTINLLPQQLNTFIGSEGSSLSGGQLQRLCIARALLNNPEVLILDEATNNLDKETENNVLQYLKAFSKKHKTTVISVSHHIENDESIFSKTIQL